jgi:hypothetical protein
MFQTVTVIGDFRDHVKSQSLTRCRGAARSADEAGHTCSSSTSITGVRINFSIVAVVTHYQDGVVLKRSENGGGASKYFDKTSSL